LLLFIPVSAQAGNDPLAQARFVSVGEADAITDGVVSAIAQDAQGLVWVGTSAGLLRYDGYQFQSFKFIKEGLSNAGTSFVRAILPSDDGKLWVGTESDGLGWFDPRSEQWTFYRSEAGNPAALSPGTIRALAQDSDGSLWVGTIGGGLNHLNPRDGSIRHYRQTDGSLTDDRIQSLLHDSRGDLWVGSWSGLARRVAGSDRFSPVFSDPAAGQAGFMQKWLGD
jgi:ligand-binding sensor domain-containing protein